METEKKFLTELRGVYEAVGGNPWLSSPIPRRLLVQLIDYFEREIQSYEDDSDDGSDQYVSSVADLD